MDRLVEPMFDILLKDGSCRIHIIMICGQSGDERLLWALGYNELWNRRWIKDAQARCQIHGCLYISKKRVNDSSWPNSGVTSLAAVPFLAACGSRLYPTIIGKSFFFFFFIFSVVGIFYSAVSLLNVITMKWNFLLLSVRSKLLQ